MNHVTLSGNLTRQPELKTTTGGTSILSFGLAVNDRRKNGQTGQWEDVAHFVDCVTFGKRAESLSQILQKGSRVYVEGKLSYSSWEAKDGSKRSKIEVVVNDLELPPRNKSQQNASQGNYGQQPNNYTDQGKYGPQNGSQGFTGQTQQADVYDSDIPF